MNVLRMIYILPLLAAISSIPLNAVAKEHDLTPRQLCERYYSSRECLDMERNRLQELQQQRARDERQDNRHRDRDTKNSENARQCRIHPESCVAPRTQGERDDYELQRLCERNYSKQQCLEMYYELHQQRARDQQESRQRDIERHESPRVIERRDVTPRDDSRRVPQPRTDDRRNWENRESIR